MFSFKNILILIGRNLIISTIVVVVTLVAIIFLSHQIEKISDSVALNHNLETKLKKRTEFFEILKNDTEITGNNDVLIENAFISSDNISKFIDVLDSLGASASEQLYHFETPAPSPISAPFPISSIAYSNSLSANIYGFIDYLEKFERMPYFTKIEGLNIQSQDELGWLGSSTTSFRATLYTKTTQ